LVVEIMMLGLLPLIAVLTTTGAAADAFPHLGWRRAFLRSLVVLGAYMILVMEGLSLIGAITKGGLVAVWLLPILLAGGWLVRARSLGRSIRLPRWERPDGALEWILLGCGLAILVVTALVAWLSPPNTWDSLAYHMARVAHWAQDRSLAPFATGNERQNLMPPAAETAMLQVYVLAGSDQLVNFVEWFAMVACIVGATQIAENLGATRLGQIFAALFVMTLPMGIAQASSTMTDYVTAMWLVCVASEAVWLIRRQPSPVDFVLLALAAGLAINTKPTAFAYLLPFAVATVIILIGRVRLPRLLGFSVMTVVVVLAVNAGYFTRNIDVYGNPLGSDSRISAHANDFLDWRVLVSNVLRNASLHAGTPNAYINKGIAVAIVKIHELIGLDPTDPRTSAHLIFRVRPPSLNEAKAGNLAQAAIVLAACIIAVWKRKTLDPLALGLASVVIATFLVISLTFKFTVFGSRYHLPFFVLCAPWVGYVIARQVPATIVRWLALGMVVVCVPWLLSLDPRPLIPAQGSGEPSILTRPRDSLYFVLDPSAEKPYREITADIRGAGCTSVGIMLSGGAAEYPIWALLGAPRADLTVEAIVAGTESAQFSKDEFEPCAIICDGSCRDDLTAIRGLTRVYDTSGYRLYMKGGPP
jgi:hypothetical protein